MISRLDGQRWRAVSGWRGSATGLRALLFLGAMLSLTARAVAAEAPARPTDVRVGAYLNSLSDLNSQNNSFSADFWIWFTHPKATALKPLESLEPESARDFRLTLQTTEDYGAERYHAAKARGVFHHPWDVTHFPFDRQKFAIRLSEAQLDASQVRYVADTANSAFDPALAVEGWKVESIAVTTDVHAYASNFGVPGKTGGSEYAGATLTITVKREAGRLFFKLHSAIYIIFLVSLVTFYMDSSKDGFFTSRISLISGMILSTVVNSQRVASILGDTNAVTLPNKIHIVTLLALVVTLLVCLATRRLHNRGKTALAQRIDWIAAPALLSIYVVINVVLVQVARAG